MLGASVMFILVGNDTIGLYIQKYVIVSILILWRYCYVSVTISRMALLSRC